MTSPPDSSRSHLAVQGHPKPANKYMHVNEFTRQIGEKFQAIYITLKGTGEIFLVAP